MSSVREGEKKPICNGTVRYALTPPHTAKTVFLQSFENKTKNYRYAYQKMQNGLKRIFFMEEKNLWF